MDSLTALLGVSIGGIILRDIYASKRELDTERAKTCKDIVPMLYPHHHRDYLRDYMIRCMENGVNSIVPKENLH